MDADTVAAVAGSTRAQTNKIHREWLHAIVKSSGLTPTALAAQIGVAASTFTRLLYDSAYQGTLSPGVIERVKQRCRVPGPEEFGRPDSPHFGTSDGDQIEPLGENPEIRRLLDAWMTDAPTITAWRLRTKALERVGYLPGDIVLVDGAQSPQAQDVVCARVLQWQNNATVFRVYAPPFNLLAFGADLLGTLPILLDHNNVVIQGVVVGSFRPHGLATWFAR